MSYLFGDTDRAALRLKVLADVFATPTHHLLQATVMRPPQLALDLGCGPGYTTRLLTDVTRTARAIGLERSEHFVTLADRSATGRMSFVRHDITQVPFPTGPSDLIYCRMLLTHLQDPQAIIERWATQLRPGGLLLVEEVEWIRTSLVSFRTYLDIVAAMLEQQGNQLYIGSRLNAMRPGGLKRLMSWVRRWPVSTSQAATVFSLNIQTWKHQPFTQQHYSSSVIERLEATLHRLAETATGKGAIRWGIRQIVYERLPDKQA